MSPALRSAALLLAAVLPSTALSGTACAAWSARAASEPHTAPRAAPDAPSGTVASGAPPAEASAPLRAAETFAMVWEKLRESGFDDDRDEIDWAALEARHRPAIEGAEDLAALRLALNRLLQAVGVSHLGLIPAEAVPQPRAKPAPAARASDRTGSDSAVEAEAKAAASPPEGAGAADLAADHTAADDTSETPAAVGLRVAIIDGALHVLSVDADSAASAAGLRPGWQVEAIDDWALERALASVQAQPAGVPRRRALLRVEMGANERLSSLDPDESVRLRLRDTRGRPLAATLVARATPGPHLTLMPGMPPMAFRYRAERLALPSGECALHVGFDLWAQPAFDRLAATVREQPDCERLILDLRGNPGGQLFAMTAVGGLLYDKTTSLGTMKTAQGSLRLTVLPRRVADDGTRLRRLGGPVAVLIDRGSASSSEIFAAGLQATGRARVFGETSAGMALPAITARLPSGDWLYFPTADMTAPDGRRIEGLGVSPDVDTAPTVASLAAGRDTTLSAALEWIGRPAAGPATDAAGAR